MKDELITVVLAFGICLCLFVALVLPMALLGLIVVEGSQTVEGTVTEKWDENGFFKTVYVLEIDNETAVVTDSLTYHNIDVGDDLEIRRYTVENLAGGIVAMILWFIVGLMFTWSLLEIVVEEVRGFIHYARNRKNGRQW